MEGGTVFEDVCVNLLVSHLQTCIYKLVQPTRLQRAVLAWFALLQVSLKVNSHNGSPTKFLLARGRRHSPAALERLGVGHDKVHTGTKMPEPRSPAKSARSPAKSARSPAKSSRGREGLKLPAAFKDLGPIAAGAYSTINKARHIESGTEIAVKVFKSKSGAAAAKASKSKSSDADVDRELEILRLVSASGHAHIANLLAEDAVEGGVLAYLQYCGGGSLAHHLAKMGKKQLAMNEANGVVLAAQITSALAHIHGLGVAHRDVKPANVLFDGRRWRLCDFGFAVLAKDRKLRDQLGSIIYCAPEILSGKSAYTGWAVDMWALGAMLYEMRTGRPAFVAADEPTLRLRIQKGFKGGSTGFPWGERMSEACRELISSLLVKAPPEDRLRAQEVLGHRWVSEHCTPGQPAPPAPGHAPPKPAPGQAAPPPPAADGRGADGGGESHRRTSINHAMHSVEVPPAAADGGGASFGGDGGGAGFGGDGGGGDDTYDDADIVANATTDDATTDDAINDDAINDDAINDDATDVADADDESGQQPHWWCDVAAEGCLRPEQPTHADQYDPRDRCWAHPDGQYMVCESCYASGEAELMDALRLLDELGV